MTRVARTEDHADRLIAEGLIAADDHAQIAWARSCGWTLPTKREFLQEQRKEEAAQADLAAQLAVLERRLGRIEKLLGPKGSKLLALIARSIGPVIGEVADHRVKGLLHDRGVWRASAVYSQGALVSHGGSAWIAQRDIAKGDKPGDGATGWRLAVKR